MEDHGVFINVTEMREPTMALRFRGKRGTATEPHILQQAFTVTVFQGGKAVRCTTKWLDVPLHLED